MRILVQNIGSADWIGGSNYLKNLIYAVRSLQLDHAFVLHGKENPTLYGSEFKFDRVLEPLDIDKIRMRAKEQVRYFEPLNGQDRSINVSFKKFLNKFKNVDLAINEIKGEYLEKQKSEFDLSFLIEDEDLRKVRPHIAWIADFQHRKYPSFFSADDIVYRDTAFLKKIKDATLVIVSSESAKSDYLDFCEQFGPRYKDKARVLHFSAPLRSFPQVEKITEIAEKYHLPKKYFLLPNQFWAHKNHQIVLSAVSILKEIHPDICVIMTGNTFDYRKLDHFPSILRQIAELGIHENIKILGILPFEDLEVLMIGSHAFINPSLFEGWSTIVEESKTFSKRIILSDIPVHLEQNPSKGIFFDPKNAQELANQMSKVWFEAPPDLNAISAQREMILKESQRKVQEFGKNFLKIAEEAIGIWKS